MPTLEVKINCPSEYQEIILAKLFEIGFDSFLDDDDSLLAYCQKDVFNNEEFSKIMEDMATKTPISYTKKELEDQNWNASWESNFKPIEIENKVIIRAPFHEPKAGFDHELIIIPKMSFGTGHHETTEQCISLQLKINHKDKKVLDVGSGTGILAILAEKLGANEILAFDIDDWAFENIKENIDLNNSKNIDFKKGTINEMPEKKYDIVLANINKNILLEEMSKYEKFLENKGHLILSGFFKDDLIDIETLANSLNLKKIDQLDKNNWMAVVFTKE